VYNPDTNEYGVVLSVNPFNVRTISKDEAISEIVQEHLKENSNYYGKEKDCDCEHEELHIGLPVLFPLFHIYI
jgi:hypothetical protein